MGWLLSKVSLPNTWNMDFPTESEAVTELRKHICGLCLFDGEDPSSDYEPLDVIFEGKIFECRDAHKLLCTPCGLEYELEEEV